jgi:hypothetical protein
MEWGKPQRNFRISVLWAKTRTQFLSTAKPEFCHYTMMLSVIDFYIL